MINDSYRAPRRYRLVSNFLARGIVRLTSRRIFKMAVSTRGNDFARVVSTAPDHASFCEVASEYERVVLHKERLKGTRGESGIAGKTRETRNNHPIIKSLTRLRLLSNVVYLSGAPAKCRRTGLSNRGNMNFASYISPTPRSRR